MGLPLTKPVVGTGLQCKTHSFPCAAEVLLVYIKFCIGDGCSIAKCSPKPRLASKIHSQSGTRTNPRRNLSYALRRLYLHQHCNKTHQIFNSTGRSDKSSSSVSRQTDDGLR